MNELLLHATCVKVKSKGILISGKPGSGKSSLALQLIDRGAILISDDQTFITLEDQGLILSPPPALKGLLEIRGMGICPFPFQEKVPLSLCVELCTDVTERLPEPSYTEYYDIQVPKLKLLKNDPLGMIKVELKIKSLGCSEKT